MVLKEYLIVCRFLFQILFYSSVILITQTGIITDSKQPLKFSWQTLQFWII